MRVFPSSPTLPVNVLRVSLAFTDRQEPNRLAEISLRYADGSPVGQAFLNQELWTPDDRTLTLIFDPGRVKTGTLAHQQLGYALKVGRVVNVLLDGRILKSWLIVGEQRVAPNPRQWKIRVPHAETREPLVMDLGRAIDYMGENSIVAVSPTNELVHGRAVLGSHESTWTFTPSEPWRSGHYRIVVDRHLEDAEGNAIDDPFERHGTPDIGLTSEPPPISLNVPIIRK